MIHTAQLLITLSDYHVAQKTHLHGKLTFNKIMLQNNIFGIKARQYCAKDDRIPRCSIFIDATVILQTGLIVENDYYRIKAAIKRSLAIVYGDEDLYDNHNLVRIDYRYDVTVPNPLDRTLYLYLYHKTRGKYSRLKRTGRDTYKTSIYHSCKSIETVLYSKNEECEAKNREPECWEKDVLRFETRIKNSHIYYQIKKNSEKKCLYNFFKQAKFEYYMREYLLKIFPTGDFYSFNLAEKLVNKTDISKVLKDSLKDFMRTVSHGTLDTPKNTIYTKSMSEATWVKRIKLFNEKNINPITIPMSKKTSYLPNLLNDLFK
ncbi:phage/plasmid replication domain-containing protein [Lysinibacillus sp. NPDC093692]|uniref:phage/plasmid replication domain-containing protein n=1 Tax=Lysinibacillus sp. NPDC093692 TaxID=3390578 RepID=UPI003D0405FE